MDFLWPGIALLAGFGAGWILSGWRSTAEMARFEGRLEELQGKLVRAQRANEALLAAAGDLRDRAVADQASAGDVGLEQADRHAAAPLDGPLDGTVDSVPNGAAGRSFADGLYDELEEDAADGDDGGYVEADDLTRIRGIGAVLQGKLYDLGIYSFERVAALTPEEAADLDRTLRLRGRIVRDDWVGQARRLSAD